MSAGAVEGTVRVLASGALERYTDASAVAFQAEAWDGRPTLAIDEGRNVPVHWCPSVLEFRERLAESSPEAPVVLLTPVSERDLGLDALSLLAGQRLRSIGVWEPVMAAFQASEIAPAVRRNESLGQTLLRLVPPGGYSPAPNGVLTDEHAWSALIAALFGRVPATGSDLLAVATDPAVTPRFREDAIERLADVLPGLTSALTDRVGDSAAAIVACLRAGFGSNAIAIGLAAEVALSDEADAALAAAAARLEPFFGRARVGSTSINAMAAAARALASEAPAPQVEAWGDAAEEILVSIEAEGAAGLSDVIPSGFERRLEAVSELLEGPVEAAAMRRALRAVSEHAQSQAQPRRVKTAQMAGRLALFLETSENEPGSLSSAAHTHLAEGGFVDFARDALDFEEPNEGVNRAYRTLASAVDKRRESRSRQFAVQLGKATAADSMIGWLGVEDALPTVVAPLATLHPITLLLLDGLSEAVFRSFQPDLERRGWQQVSTEGLERTPMIAMLPTLTKYSRTSFFSGRRTLGGQAEERSGLAEVMDGVGATRLFHKADLADRDTIAGALSDPAVRVVAVVVNSIDDQLDKGDELDQAWCVERIEPLSWLLADTANAGRALVLAGDHGHVLERGSDLRAADGAGARWRPIGDPEPMPDEVLAAGPRVMIDGQSAILAGTERVRYRKKAAGYHGGGTPQEAVAPLVVLTPPGIQIAGYEPPADPEPAWWLLEEASPTRPVLGSLVVEPDQPALFGEPEKPRTASWISELLASDLYRSNRERLARAPADDLVAALLAALEQRDYVLSDGAAAAALQVAELRVGGVIATVQPLLNVENFVVLSRDRGAGEIRLDRELLKAQFGI